MSVPPIIGNEKEFYKHSKGSSIERLRAILWSSHHTRKLTTNYSKFGPWSHWDVPTMESYIKINQFGKNQLQRYLGKEYDNWPALPPKDVDYYKYQLLNGPWRSEVLPLVRKGGEKFWKHHSPCLGITGDINHRSHLATPVYDYTTPVFNISVMTKRKIPNFIWNNIDSLHRSTRGLLYQNIYGSLKYDGKDFDSRRALEPTNQLQRTAHGHRMVCDVNRYLLTVEVFEIEIIGKNRIPGMKQYNTSYQDDAEGTGTPAGGSCVTSDEDDSRYTGTCGSTVMSPLPCKGLYPTYIGCNYTIPGRIVWEIDGQVNDDFQMNNYYKHSNLFSSICNKEKGFKGPTKRKIEYYSEQKEHTANSSQLIKKVTATPGATIIKTDYSGVPYESAWRMKQKYRGEKKTALHSVPGMLGHGERKTSPRSENTHPFVVKGFCCDSTVCWTWSYPE